MSTCDISSSAGIGAEIGAIWQASNRGRTAAARDGWPAAQGLGALSSVKNRPKKCPGICGTSRTGGTTLRQKDYGR
jgi:hypothetical protein